MTSLLLLLAGLQASPPVPPPPPVVVVTPLAQPRSRPVPTIATFEAGPARCGGAAQTAVETEAPLPAGLMRAEGAAAESAASVRLRFRIAEDGRPLSIRREPSDRAPYVDARDVPAAFAAWRFAPGEPRDDCEIEFAVRTRPVAEAPMPDLYRFLALQRPNTPGAHAQVGRAAFERAAPAGSDCFEPRPPAVRLRAYPAFEEIAQRPGTLSYSFLAFDIDSKGRPVKVRLLGSSDNAELDRRSVAAIERSRFAPEARTGCTYYYFRSPEAPLAAPPAPPASRYRPEDSACPDEESAWASMPPLVFPGEFQRRAIEGWAAVRYDVAPWGEPGNLQIIASEPAEAFGTQAERIVRGARKPESWTGYSGCVVRVRFRMPPAGGTEEDGPPPQ